MRFLKLILLIFSIISISSCSDEESKIITGPLEILAVGDSLIEGYSLPEKDTFPAQLQAVLNSKNIEAIIYNEGVNGEKALETSKRLETLIHKYPNLQLVILVTGGNDIIRATQSAEFLSDLRTGITNSANIVASKNIPLIIGGMKAPISLGLTKAAAVSSIYKKVAKDTGAILYPFFLEGVYNVPNYTLGDNIHPNRYGVALIVGNILPLVLESIKR